jgi:translation initiation factor IF-2
MQRAHCGSLHCVFMTHVAESISGAPLRPFQEAEPRKRVLDLSIRIYALAKKLKLESKALLDICKAAGVLDKGSALASLTDEQVSDLESYMKKGGGAAATKPKVEPTDPAMVRPSSADRGRVPVIKASPKKIVDEDSPQDEAVPEAVAEEEVVSDVESEEPLEEAVAESEETVVAEVAPVVEDESVAKAEAENVVETVEATESVEEEVEEQPEEAPASTAQRGPIPHRREDYIGPGGAATKPVPVMGGRRPKKVVETQPAQGASEATTLPKKRPPKRAAPTIALAPIPASPAEPKKQKKKKEPAPQKPEIRLRPDLLRGAGKPGGRPLSEHLRMHEEKRAEEKKSESTPKTPGAPGAKRPVPLKPLVIPPKTAPETKKRRRGGQRRHRDGSDFVQQQQSSPRRQNYRRFRRTRTVNTAAPRKSDVVVQLPCSIRDFAQECGVPLQKILGKALELGMMLNINGMMDAETAGLIVEAMELSIDLRTEQSLEERVIAPFQEEEDSPESLLPRPPIVTFLGHVDHGKTSLLDNILKLNVVDGEKGGITQHIRAYRVKTEGGDVTFVDTPGHEAFTEMRARGANVTDLAVLVVAADDGVMPQTEEAISHAKAAGVPIVVALNKIDLPGVTADKALQDLAANELLASEWGGDIEVVRTSAITGEGMSELLETLLMMAELHELKANPDRPASGVCLEAELQQGRGVVGKLIVEKGTLKVGDVVVCGSSYGRVKAMYDTLEPRKQYEKAGPATPVNLTGLDSAPNAGDHFYVLDNIADARELAEKRGAEMHQEQLGGVPAHITLESLFERLGDKAEKQTLNVILRSDVRGSIEAIRKELTKLDHPEVQIKLLQASVGGITEADVHLADASDAIIIGFNVVPDEGARILADKRGVQVRRYEIIYKMTEDLRNALEGMLKPEEREKDLGRVLVQRVFSTSKIGSIAGCRIIAGTVERGSRVRLIRESRIIGDYAIDSLRREKDDVKEVREGYECGIRLKNYNDIKEGDIFEAYKIEEIARTL